MQPEAFSSGFCRKIDEKMVEAACTRDTSNRGGLAFRFEINRNKEAWNVIPRNLAILEWFEIDSSSSSRCVARFLPRSSPSIEIDGIGKNESASSRLEAISCWYSTNERWYSTMENRRSGIPFVSLNIPPVSKLQLCQIEGWW